jgi:glutaredoxin-like protein NrdH
MRCTLTCGCLEAAGIPFDLVDLRDEQNAALRLWITEDLGYTEAPVVLVGDEPEHHWSGFRPDLIDKLTRDRSAESERAPR